MTQNIDGYFVWYMLKNYHIKQQTKHCGPSMKLFKIKEVYANIHMYILYIRIITSSSIGYRLVIICSSQDEEKTPIISKLHLHRRPYVVSSDINKYKTYLRKHFIDEQQPSYQQLQQAIGSVPIVKASIVDDERYVCKACRHY